MLRDELAVVVSSAKVKVGVDGVFQQWTTQ